MTERGVFSVSPSPWRPDKPNTQSLNAARRFSVEFELVTLALANLQNSVRYGAPFQLMINHGNMRHGKLHGASCGSAITRYISTIGFQLNGGNCQCGLT